MQSSAPSKPLGYIGHRSLSHCRPRAHSREVLGSSPCSGSYWESRRSFHQFGFLFGSLSHRLRQTSSPRRGNQEGFALSGGGAGCSLNLQLALAGLEIVKRFWCEAKSDGLPAGARNLGPRLTPPEP